jgi:hypothetical protein
MPDSEDGYQWPNYATGPKKHLEALGVICLNFNLYELSLEEIQISCFSSI